MHDDELIAIEGTSARSQIHSADVILGDVEGREAGFQWVIAAFKSYPGCTVAAAYHAVGDWCLLAVRDGLTLLMEFDRGRLDHDVVETAARTLYRSVVTRQRKTVVAALNAASPIPTQVTPLVIGDFLVAGSEDSS